MVLQRDDAQRAVAADDGDCGEGVRPIGARRQAEADTGLLGAGVRDAGLAAAQDPCDRLVGLQRSSRWQRQRQAVLVAVQRLDPIGLVVPPHDAQVAGGEHLAQLVAHQFDDGLELQLGRHALLDAVDQRQFAGALLELGGAFGHLALQALAGAQVGQCHGGLGGQCREPVAVNAIEATGHAVDVAIQAAQPFALGDQRGDDAGALVDRRGTVGSDAKPSGCGGTLRATASRR